MMHGLTLLGQAGGMGNMGMLVALAGAMVFFFWFSGRANRKEKQQFQQMLDNLKKNDRVITIGGITGSVVSSSKEEVVIKVDESANVKITFARWAIKSVLTDGAKVVDAK